MDSIFGIGLPEFVLILLIAGMVMGPERIARGARSLGVLTAKLQAVSQSFFRQLNAELDSADEGGQLKSTVEELNQLRRQVADLRNEMITLTSGVAADSQQAVRDIKKDTVQAIKPPRPVSRRDISPAKVDDKTPVYRPPSLSPVGEALPVEGGNENALPTIKQPARLPRRVDVLEDPDE